MELWWQPSTIRLSSFTNQNNGNQSWSDDILYPITAIIITIIVNIIISIVHPPGVAVTLLPRRTVHWSVNYKPRRQYHSHCHWRKTKCWLALWTYDDGRFTCSQVIAVGRSAETLKPTGLSLWFVMAQLSGSLRQRFSSFNRLLWVPFKIVLFLFFRLTRFSAITSSTAS